MPVDKPRRRWRRPGRWWSGGAVGRGGRLGRAREHHRCRLTSEAADALRVGRARRALLALKSSRTRPGRTTSPWCGQSTGRLLSREATQDLCGASSTEILAYFHPHFGDGAVALLVAIEIRWLR